jgi:hypothetical protein
LLVFCAELLLPNLEGRLYSGSAVTNSVPVSF